MRKIVWIRVAIALVVGVTLAFGTIRLLGPRSDEVTDAKYMHCDVCHLEMIYSAKLAGGRCPKCQPPKFGKLIATRHSVAGGSGNPWRLVNILVSFELVFTLGAIVAILYMPPSEPAGGYGYTQCKSCKRRLRFPARLAGIGAGWCPLCRAMFAYPAEIGEPFEDES